MDNLEGNNDDLSEINVSFIYNINLSAKKFYELNVKDLCILKILTEDPQEAPRTFSGNS